MLTIGKRGLLNMTICTVRTSELRREIFLSQDMHALRDAKLYEEVKGKYGTILTNTKNAFDCCQ